MIKSLNYLKLFKMSLVAISLAILTSCGQKSEEAPTGPLTPVDPKILNMAGGLLVKTAGVDVLEINSQLIYNELDQVVRDGYEFTLTGEEGVKVSASVDGPFTDTALVTSLSGKIKFYLTAPTKVGTYRALAQPKDSSARGRFFINVEPGGVALLGQIKGTVYEDEPPYNGQKDDFENYTILGDGQSTRYIYVGPILDQYANPVQRAKVRLTIDKGTLISENPVNISDGLGIFRIESTAEAGLIAIQAEALNDANQVIASLFGHFESVRPHLQITESGDFGNVLVNETKTKTFILKNIGNTSATNLFYSSGTSFPIDPSSTCRLNHNLRLRPNEQCQIKVNFTGGIRATFNDILRVTADHALLIPEAKVEVPLLANTVAVANLAIEEGEFSIDFGSQVTCGDTIEEEIIVKNTGDLVGQNFRVIQPPPHTGQASPFISVILPPADAVFPSDPDAIVNCGTSLPPNRRCRVIIRYRPLALVTQQPLNAQLLIDGIEPVGLILRGGSQPGNPAGTIPVSFSLNSGMPLGDNNVNAVTVGPIKDACGLTVRDNFPISASVTAGSLPVANLVTNGGMATFNWTSSNDPNTIGVQSFSVTSGAASGSKTSSFLGIKLVMTAVTGEIGQILTTKPRSGTPLPPNQLGGFIYSIKNEGTETADNLNFSLLPEGLSWAFIDTNYDGGCKDNTLLVGEICTLRLNVDSSTFGAGALSGTFRVFNSQPGINLAQVALTGTSVLPPTIEWEMGATNIPLGNFIAGTTPSRTLTLRNLSTGTVNDLKISLSSPFEEVSRTCGTTLVGGGSCTITIRLPVTAASPAYVTTVSATGEDTTITRDNISVSAGIVANVAAGSIPVSFDRASVPANASAEIVVTLGPVRDAYNNLVVSNTPIEVTTTAGKMNIDTDNDRVALIGTDALGRASLRIRSSTTSEITNFTLTARVKDGSNNVLASGTRDGAFTGVILGFTESSKDFGRIAVGTLSAEVITLRNTGNETATNILFSSSGSNFVLQGQSSCTSLAPNQSCDVVILFNPTAPGIYSGTVNVNSSGNGILSASISLVAEAVEAAKLVTAVDGIFTDGQGGKLPRPNNNLTINYVPGAGASGTFVIQNQGQDPFIEYTNSLVNLSPSISGFSFTTPTSCRTLGLNQTCTITVNFNPTSIVPSLITGRIDAIGDSLSRTTIDSVNLTVRAAQFILTKKEFNQPVNGCAAYEIQLQNFLEQPVNAAGLVSINLSTNQAGAFFSNSSCTTGITSTQIASGQNKTNTFYYKGTAAADHTLTMSSSTLRVTHLVTVFTSPSLSPASIAIAPNDTVNFSTSGGKPSYSYAVVTPGGGTINANNGSYTAPATAGTYTVRVTDNLGNTADAVVTVEDIKITAGKGFMCYSTGGIIYCTGQNAFGQWNSSGNIRGSFNEPIPVNKPTSYTYSIAGTELFAGSFHMCYMRADNRRLYCQGLNNYGQAGANNSYADAGVLPTASTITLLAGNSKNKVDASWGHHTCAINNANEVLCFGRNDQGQLGIANTTFKNFAAQTVSAGTNDFAQVATGELHSCGLHGSGSRTINCWGYNANGQLGDATTVNKNGTTATVLEPVGLSSLSNIREIVAGRYHTCAVNTSNQAYCWGQNVYGQIGNGNFTQQNRPVLVASNVRNIYAGGFHTCIVNTSGAMSCWGRNDKGQLGNGLLTNSASAVAVSGLTSLVYDVALGDDFSCAVHLGNQVKCWGDNTYGQLSQTSIASFSTPQLLNTGASMTCPTGMTYNSGNKSCTCNTGAYHAASRTCLAPTLSALNTTPTYTLPNVSHELQYRVTNGANLFANIPVPYIVVSGNGSLLMSKMISDDNGNAYNNFIKGSLNQETVGANLQGQSNVNLVFRNHLYSCQEYQDLYGFTAADNGARTIRTGPSSTAAGYCRFYPGSGYAYTYDNLTDYNALQYLRTAPEGGTINVSCPFSTSIVFQSGEYYSSTESCNFSFLDLQNNLGVINDSLCLEPPLTTPKTGRVQWNCQ